MSVLDECWEWHGSRDKDGYGKKKMPGFRGARMTHRLAWAWANGPIPDGMFICHHCDNPPCCNPAHLFVGTNRTNQLDCIEKGRFPQVTQTHCKRGHPFDEANTRKYIRQNGRQRRVCRACNRVAVRRYNARASMEINL